MLIIDCPYCGRRESAEFSYGGDASAVRPPDPEAVSDVAWTDFLFNRDNPKGPHLEHWFHRDGCRGWLEVKRSTVTHQIESVSPAGRGSRRS